METYFFHGYLLKWFVSKYISSLSTPPPRPWGERGQVLGSLSSLFEEEYQVVKTGKEYYGCGEKYNVEKRERGSNIIFPIKVRLLGRISRRLRGRGRKFWG